MSGVKHHDHFFLTVARNKVNNVFTTHRYGTNSSVSTAEETIWTAGGIRPLPTTTSQFDIVSTSANDTAAGTGLRTLLFEGLDENFLEQAEVVTLNGTTIVQTVNSYLRINRLLGLTSGSNNSNVGTITAKIGSTVYENIAVNRSRSASAVYTVPEGKNAYISNISSSTAGKDVVFLISGYFIGPTGHKISIHEEYLAATTSTFILPTNPQIPGTTTFELRATKISGSDAPVGNAFDLLVVTE